MTLLIGVLTVSDRASKGLSQDLSGPKAVELLKQHFEARNPEIVSKIVPDEIEDIKSTLIQWCNLGHGLIITTGGTGFAPRDVTPEATKQVIERETPGITTAMMMNSLHVTPHAMLSRAVSGIRGNTLIVNLPGSPKAVSENLNFILPPLSHGLELLKNVPNASLPESHKFHSHSQPSQQKNNNNHDVHSHSHSHSHDTHLHSHFHGAHHGSPLRRVSPWPMIPVEEAQNTVLSLCHAMPIIKVSLQEAVGFILAHDVTANEPLPPFRASVKDGYALMSQDGPGEYPVVGTVTAGKTPSFQVTQGTVARITTGSPVPDECDSVIMVERTELLPQSDKTEIVRLLDKVVPGQDVREIGSDIQKDEIVLNKSDRITAAHVGLLASVGVTEVSVYDLPKVGIMSSGDEVIDPFTKEDPKFGQIRDSNRSMLIGAIQEAEPVYCHPSTRSHIVDLGIAQDVKEDIEKTIMSALQTVDVIITTGGVSMGELDLIQPILQKLGKVHFGRILMKPGKPLTFATIQCNLNECNTHKTANGKTKLVFGLPGNPVSSMVTFLLVCLPAIRCLAGHSNPRLPQIKVKLAHKAKMDPERPEYMRAVVTWQEDAFVATATGSQHSSRLLSMKANTLVLIPQGSGVLEAGSFVPAFIIGRL